MSVSLGLRKCSHFSPVTKRTTPPCTGYVHLPNAFFWTVTVTTTDTGQVNFSIPLLSKIVAFFVVTALPRISITKLITSCVLKHCTVTLVWRSGTRWNLVICSSLLELQDTTKTTWKRCHLHASFCVTSYITDHVTGLAQWLECRTRDWKVTGSNPCRSGWRIFFSRVNFLCWLLFRYPFHPCVTAVARKRPRSFCQKCRWQVTAKHAYTLRMWLCMKWHGAWLYGVHRTHWDGSSFMCHQPCQRCKYTTSVDSKKRAIKSYSLM